ncbi:unnamed protein product, partial [Amoebophrya sp. A120]|eukprot:GSA120T00003445001.1
MSCRRVALCCLTALVSLQQDCGTSCFVAAYQEALSTPKFLVGRRHFYDVPYRYDYETPDGNGYGTAVRTAGLVTVYFPIGSLPRATTRRGRATREARRGAAGAARADLARRLPYMTNSGGATQRQSPSFRFTSMYRGALPIENIENREEGNLRGTPIDNALSMILLNDEGAYPTVTGKVLAGVARLLSNLAFVYKGAESVLVDEENKVRTGDVLFLSGFELFQDEDGTSPDTATGGSSHRFPLVHFLHGDSASHVMY